MATNPNMLFLTYEFLTFYYINLDSLSGKISFIFILTLITYFLSTALSLTALHCGSGRQRGGSLITLITLTCACEPFVCVYLPIICCLQGRGDIIN
jgi:hypothetical protein